MASLYQRPRSPFWWISYRDSKTGRVSRRSTRFRVGVGTQTRKARQLCAEYTLSELSSKATRSSEQWDQWVTDYLVARYPNARSLERMKIVWANLKMFLEEKQIAGPRDLTREHCLAYVPWRLKPNKAKGKFRAGHNTAVSEMKSLAMLMNEAVRRGYCVSNPCRDLGLRMRERKLKPELSDADIEFIRGKIELEPEPLRTFLRNSFQIARYQGCRISETQLNPMTDVDILPSGNNKIRFRAKGGRTHEAPLHPELVPFFAVLKARGETQTYPRRFNRSHWRHFLVRTGLPDRLPNVCFHSLRVTAASRMARAGVSEAKAMRFLGHASTAVHRAYQRIQLEDLGDALKAIS